MITAPLNIVESKKNNGHAIKCPGFFTHGTCENGHSFVKLIHCGREWCPVCGAEYSDIHNRRIARMLPKAQQMNSMGYFVFTIPADERYKFRKKQQFSHLMKMMTSGNRQNKVPGILEKYGFTRGIARWHWFGDQSTSFNPHLNVIVEAGYIPNSTIRAIKREWKALIGSTRENVSVHYEYRSSIGQMIHTVEYVSRPTFTDINLDPIMADELYNFRNIRYWGKWNDPAEWSPAHGHTDYATIGKLERSKCPDCGKQLHWSDSLPITVLYFKSDQLEEIRGGYFRYRPKPRT